MKQSIVFSVLIILVTLCGCREEVFVPKPRGYYTIEFPDKKYTTFNGKGYPYSFNFPVYGTIEKDTLFFNEKTENPWWININYTPLGGKVFLSYKRIKSKADLSKMLEDSYQLSHYHTKKADFIDEPTFHTENNVHGVFYNVGGNSASAFQFYATDSVNHFLRGALYFDVTPNADSLKPINEFLIEDIKQMVQTIRWK